MSTIEKGFHPEMERSKTPDADKPAATFADLEGAADRIAAWRKEINDNEKRRKKLKKKPGFLRDGSEKLALDGGIDEQNQDVQKEIDELKHTMDLAKPGMAADAEALVDAKAELFKLKKKGSPEDVKAAEARLAVVRGKYETDAGPAASQELLQADWGEEAASAKNRQELLQADWGAEAEPKADGSVEIDHGDLELDLELARAEREFEPQFTAAEREIKDASEAFVKTINELLTKIEQTPLGTEMRGAIEKSPDNIRLKQAIAKLDGLRKERTAVREALWDKYPAAEISVTEDMIIGYEEEEAPVEARERQLPPPLPVVEAMSSNLPPPPPPDAMRESVGLPAENELGLAALRNATDIDSLKAAVKTLGKIEGRQGQEYPADELNELIDQAVKFPVLLNRITRANGLREKVGELIAASNKEQQAELKTEYAAEVAKSDDLTAPEKKAAAEILEKNELSPERRAQLEAEIKKLERRMVAIKEGAILIQDRETGESEAVTGLDELEKKLASMGVNADELLEKKATSGWERFKFGLKALARPELDRTIKQYQECLKDRMDTQDNLELAKLELKNPRKYAVLMRHRLMRTLGASASIRARQQSSPTSFGTLKL